MSCVVRNDRGQGIAQCASFVSWVCCFVIQEEKLNVTDGEDFSSKMENDTSATHCRRVFEEACQSHWCHFDFESPS